MRITDRLMYGPIVDKGKLTSEKKQKFRKMFEGIDNAQILTYEAGIYGNFIFSLKNYLNETKGSWETMEENLQEVMQKPEYSRSVTVKLDEALFFFEYRKNSKTDYVKIKTRFDREGAFDPTNYLPPLVFEGIFIHKKL